MVRAALDAGATVINTSFHRFSPCGVSGVVVIQESHLAIHTWPEHGFAAIDVFTCGDDLDPQAACRSISAALDADRCDTRELSRGDVGLIQDGPGSDQPVQPTDRGPDTPSSYVRNIWFTERDEDIALSLRHAGALFRQESEVQRVEVLSSYRYGKILVLDGAVAFTEQDESVYHEMIVHPAVLTHGDVRKALVIGGGDGGACRELLRHTSVEAVTVVEIDPVVLEACRAHFPDVAGSLEDARVHVEVGDGVAYLASHEDAFDLIIVDAGSSPGSAGPLSTETFYQGAKRSLASGGVLCAQTPRPTLDSDSFRSVFRNQRSAFGSEHVHCFLAFIPSFTTGLVSFSHASNDVADPSRLPDLKRARSFVEEQNLRYYSQEIHASAFVLPRFIKAIVSNVD